MKMTFFLNFLFFVQAQTVTVQSDIERHTDIYKQVSLTWWNLSHFHLDLYFTMLKVRGIKHHKLINLIKNGVCALCVHFVNPFRHCCQIKLVDLTFSHSACWSDLFKYSLFIWPFQIQLVCLTFTMFTYKFWRCYYFYSDLFIVQWQIFHAFSVPIRQKSNKEGMYTDWVDGDGDFHWESVFSELCLATGFYFSTRNSTLHLQIRYKNYGAFKNTTNNTCSLLCLK